MGGKIFDKTKQLDKIEYDDFIIFINNLFSNSELNYLIPLRFKNKITYSDIDIILSDIDKFINQFNKTDKYKILETKNISLFEKRYNQYSKHILTKQLYQIDLIKPWNEDSIEITRVYYSYSFANIFFKRIINLVDRNLNFSYLGIMCSSNKYIIPNNIKFLQIDNSTKLIIDCAYAFELMDLDYKRFNEGFVDEIEFLVYLKKSKFYSQIKFKSNSKFKHDYSRLKPFANLVDLKLIDVENFN